MKIEYYKEYDWQVKESAYWKVIRNETTQYIKELYVIEFPSREYERKWSRLDENNLPEYRIHDLFNGGDTDFIFTKIDEKQLFIELL